MTRNSQDIYLELLVLRCKRGDKQAIEELITNWERRLFYFIRRLVENESDAWDVLQQTWIKVLHNIKSLRDCKSLTAWLYTIARTTAFTHRRTRSRYKAALAAEKSNHTQVTTDNNLQFDNTQLVHFGLDQLSLPHREALTLFFLEDMSVGEIAQIVGAAPGTIKSRLHYAKQSLRLILEKEGTDNE